MQLQFTLSDSAMEETFFDTPFTPSLRNLKSLHGCLTSPPSCGFAIAWKNTILQTKYSSPSKTFWLPRVCHFRLVLWWTRPRLQRQPLPRTKDKSRDTDMYSSKKRKQWYFRRHRSRSCFAPAGLGRTLNCRCRRYQRQLREICFHTERWWPGGSYTKKL